MLNQIVSHYRVLDGKQHTPLGRLGSAERVAKAYLWLASSHASFLMAALPGVDGGVVVGT